MESKQHINNPVTICFVAGKSGGHIIPCLTLAQQYITNNKGTPLLFFSNKTPLDKKILCGKSIISQHVMLSISPFFYKKIHRYPQIIAEILYSFIISFYYLCKYKPKQVITTGGVIALPVCLAAFLLRIPIVLYELNAIPGKSIKFLAFFAQTIWYCFDEAQNYLPKNKSKKKAYPIRFSSSYLPIPADKARKRLMLCPEKKTITILGGSQGSLFINNLIKQWLSTCSHLHPNIQLIHQTGAHDRRNWNQLYQKLSISALVCSYQDDPALWYIASDLILCRAGAGTLFEVDFFDKQCITIPLETTTTSHQINNAYAMAMQYPHHFSLLEQKKLRTNPEQLFIYLNKLYEKPVI